ncbi:hypothetical protein JW964_25785 [candidate division KSB1 bacterium]|nr:hypothetical protein [candidate division KSB1 bacterium]
MPKYFLRIEPVNFENAIYDTNDISTIRGASFMLLNAFDQLKDQFQEYDIGTSASVGLFAFEAENEDAAKKIRQNIITSEPLAKIKEYATVLHKMEKADTSLEFPLIMQKLQADVRWQQYQTPTLLLPFDIISSEPCKLDGVRPAVKDDYKGAEKIKVSNSVYSRRNPGKDLRQEVYEKILGERPKYAFTNDLEALSTDTKRGNLNGKIAFIHLDGNRFGSARNKKCNNKELLLDFQKQIQNKMRKSALGKIIDFASAPENNSFRTDDDEIRLETLLWGGDEVDWIVPAWQVLNVLDLFYKTTAMFEQWEGLTLTHSAGVVFCHHNLPILQVRQYARQLCDLAKQGIPRNINQIDSSANRIAFLNLAAFDLIGSDVEEFMKSFYTPAQPADFIIENTAKNLNEWQEHVLILKRYFPRNKIYALLKALKEGQETKVKEIIDRAKKLIHGQSWNEQIEPAINSLTQNHQEPHRWFLISDLINYVGEDQ